MMLLSRACVPLSASAFLLEVLPQQLQRRFKYRVFIKAYSLNKYFYIYAPCCFVASALGPLEGFVLAICLVSIAGNKFLFNLFSLNVGTKIGSSLHNCVLPVAPWPWLVTLAKLTPQRDGEFA